MTRHHVAFSGLLGCLIWVHPQTAIAQTEPQQRQPIGIRVQTIADDKLNGTLESLSLDRGMAITLGGRSSVVQIPAADLVRVAFQNADADATDGTRRDGFQITLANGDEIRGMIVGGDDETIVIESPVFGAVRLPIEFIAMIEAPNANKPGFRKSVRWLRQGVAGDSDRILLTNADVVRGFVASISADGITVETDTGFSTLDFNVVVAIRMLPTPMDSSVGMTARLSLSTAGRVTVGALRIDDRGRVLAELVFGEKITLPLRTIGRIDFAGGRWVWLSTRTPAKAQQTPMMNAPWPHRIDRNVRGGPLSVAGSESERGIGVHARSRLVYELDKQYSQFVTQFGIDDDSGPYADVVMRVLVDGEERVQREHIRAGTLYGPVRIDLRGANSLELVVDFGDNAGIQDRFDWIEPALIR